jgi:hypothetical protein
LTSLDTYGVSLVKEYFVEEIFDPDAVLSFTYDYNLLSRWLMKVFYNSQRSNKRDLSIFHDQLDYIRNIGPSKVRFSLFGALAINTSPVPPFLLPNYQLIISPNPGLLIDTYGIEGKNHDPKVYHHPYLKGKHFFRAGTGLFLMLFWDENATGQEIIDLENAIAQFFPYTLLKEDETTVELKRATHAFNYSVPYCIDSRPSMAFADILNKAYFKSGNPIASRRENSIKWDQHVTEARRTANEKRTKKKKKR